MEGGTFQEMPEAQHKEPKPPPHSQHRKGIVLYGNQFLSSECVYNIFTWAVVVVPCYVVVPNTIQAESMTTGQRNRLVECFLT